MYTEFPDVEMTESQHVVGVFRDRRQAELAIYAARRRGLAALVSNQPLDQDAPGFHVLLRGVGAPDELRELLLDYGAYTAGVQ